MPESKSVVLHAFVDEVKDTFPPEQIGKLNSHAAAIAMCTEHHDHKRSHRCATWAIDLVKSHETDHRQWAEIKEAYRFWEDAWAGIEWSPRMRISPEQGIRTEWAQASVDVARRVAQLSGWDAVPWEELLVELIEMEDH